MGSVGGDDGVVGGGVLEYFDGGLEFVTVYAGGDEDVGRALVEGDIGALEEAGEGDVGSGDVARQLGAAFDIVFGATDQYDVAVGE